MEWVLYTIIGILTTLLGASVYYNLKFGRIILNIQDSVEESLDVLDERYEEISKICKMDLYYDSPEVKRVHRSLEVSRESVLHVASILCNGFNNSVSTYSDERDPDDVSEG